MAVLNTNDIDKLLKDLEPIIEDSQKKPSKRTKKRQKKAKKPKKQKNKIFEKVTIESESSENDEEIELIQERFQLEKWNPHYEEFEKILQVYDVPDNLLNPSKIVKQEDDEEGDETENLPQKNEPTELLKTPNMLLDNTTQKLSNRRFKQTTRISIAELKAYAKRPDLVELHDPNSKEAKLLVYLKCYRNSVGVPKHWIYKRRYLQGKRGFMKPLYELPDFIKATGIMEMRSAYQHKENAQNLKAHMRNKIRPRLGRVDVDYQKLHDAFFKYQTRPHITLHGDLYYEGKEYEARMKDKKPGDLTDELRLALGMPVGMNKHLVPPPWLIAMQRYGPPPSYPNLKISGLNAPLPEGAAFGYQVGGWGKPPVDETGRPLYGDVFGADKRHQMASIIPVYEYQVDKKLWGEIDSENSDGNDDREENMEDVGYTGEYEDGSASSNDLDTEFNKNEIGLETPAEMVVQKSEDDEKETINKESTAEVTNNLIKKSLYTILPQKKIPALHKFLFNSSHSYEINNEEVGVDSGSVVPETTDGLGTANTDLMTESSNQAESLLKVQEKKTKNVKKDLKKNDKSKKYKDFKF